MSSPLPNFWGLRLADLEACKPPVHAPGLYARLMRAGAFERAEAPLGRAAREFTEGSFDLALPLVESSRRSADGSTKLVFRLADGALVEAVHMPRAVKNARVTLCISSQVGCAMGCTFCHTATMGLVRNLEAHEIVGQVVAMLRTCGPHVLGRVSVVFMGMGEPLHNLAHVERAVAILSDEAGLSIPEGRITVSTSGLVPGIEAMASWARRPTLALSLNATTDEARTRLMPVTKKWGLKQLRRALLEYPQRSHEKITLEYVLLRGENDTPADAARLGDFVRGYRHHVNVIPFNDYEGARFSEPAESTLESFLQCLYDAGCLATVRRSRGRDVGAACGQLVRPGRASPRVGV